MRLLIVSNGYPPTAYGGVENYSADLARSLALEGVDVSVICPERRGDLSDGEVLQDSDGSITVFRVVNDFKRRIGFYETFADPLLESIVTELIGRLSPDVVHINHLITLSARLPHIFAEAGIPMVYTLHDFWPLCQRVNLVDWRDRRCPGPVAGGDCVRCLTTGTLTQRLRTWAIDVIRSVVPYRVRAILRRVISGGTAAAPSLRPSAEGLEQRHRLFREGALLAGAILAPSAFVAARFAANGWPDGRIGVLPLGLDWSEDRQATPRPLSEGRLRVGYIGSLLPIKGVDTLLRAFRQVRSRHASLEIFGRGDIMPGYTRRLRLLASGDRRTTFRGPFDPSMKDDVYRGLDVLVIPSRAQETFSFVAREALLRGVPVIAAQVGALPEVVAHSSNGWLFAESDANQLASLLTEICDHPGKLRGLELPGRFEILTVRQHAARLRSVYASLVA